MLKWIRATFLVSFSIKGGVLKKVHPTKNVAPSSSSASSSRTKTLKLFEGSKSFNKTFVPTQEILSFPHLPSLLAGMMGLLGIKEI